MRVTDGTAAVCADCTFVDESQSLGKPEKAECAVLARFERKSEDLLEMYRRAAAEYGRLKTQSAILRR